MNPELEERLSEYRSAKHEIVELVAGLDDDQFNARPDPRNWSMAECVDHLVLVGRKIVPRMDTAIIRARGQGWTSEGPFRYGRLEKWFAAGMSEVPPRRRLKTPRLYRPPEAEKLGIPRAVEEFAALQDKFIRVVNHAEGLDLSRIKVASPVTPLVRLSLGQWLLGLAGHQRRHMWQAEQVKEKILGEF